MMKFLCNVIVTIRCVVDFLIKTSWSRNVIKNSIYINVFWQQFECCSNIFEGIVSNRHRVSGLWCLIPLSPIFQLYGVGQFYRWRKPPTCRKTLTEYHIMLHRVHPVWVGIELTTLVVMGTDCIGSCKSNYNQSRWPFNPTWHCHRHNDKKKHFFPNVDK